MASGINYKIQFNTNQQPVDNTKYPFSTKSNKSLTFDVFEAFDGDSFSFLSEKNINFYICNDDLFWEYDVDSCTISYLYDSENIFCELSVKEKTNISLNLCNKYSWDYSTLCNSYFHDGENMSCELFLIKNDTPVDFYFSCKNYQFEYNPKFSFYFIDDEEFTISVNLDKSNNYDFLICKSDCVDYNYNIICDEDRTIERKFVVDIKDDDVFNFELSFANKYLTVGGIQDENFNLESCTQQSDFIINGCEASIEIDGKNKNFDFQLCTDNQNPNINFQTFVYYNPWNIECGSGWSFLFNDGEVFIPNIAKNIILDVNNYDGESSTSSLLFDIALFSIGYDGEYTNCIFTDNPFDQLESDNYDGESSEAKLLFDISLPLNSNYDGEYTNCIFTDNPFDQLESDNYDGESLISNLQTSSTLVANGYSGEYSDCDFTTIPLISISCINHDGEYSDCDFTDNPAPSMVAIGYDGEYSDVTMNVTYALYPVGHDGEYSDVTMNVTYALYPVGYDGEYSDCDFTDNPADFFEIVYFDGEHSDVTMNVAVAFGVSLYDSEYSNLDSIYLPPPTSIYAIGYDGEYSDVILSEDLFYFRNYDGDYVDVTMNTTASITPIGYDGEYVDCYLGTAEAIYPDFIYDGEYTSVSDLYVHTGEELESENYDGENMDIRMPMNVELYPSIIVSSESMYDMERNFNFCETTQEVSPDGDSVIFDTWNSDRKWYGLCGPKSDDEFIFELSTNKRLEVNFSEGELAYTKEYTYLTPNKIFDNETTITTIFESKEIFRFCPGYIIPSGNNVNFDFSAEIIKDCFGWFILDGESVSCSLGVPAGLAVRNYDGDYSYTQVYIPGKWVLLARDSETFQWVNLEMTAIAHSDETMYISMERRAYVVGDGEYAMTFDLRTSSPNIEWVTPLNTCLTNEYIPHTPSGDPDLSYDYIPNAIENRIFWTRLNAKCVLDYQYYTIFQPFFYEGESLECSLYTDDGEISGVSFSDSESVELEF